MTRFARCIVVVPVLVFTSSKYKKLIYLLIFSVNGAKVCIKTAVQYHYLYLISFN